MKRKRSAPDCLNTSARTKRCRSVEDAPLPSSSTKPRSTPDGLPSPPASASPLLFMLASKATTDTAPPAGDLLSPGTPVYHRSTPNPDFEKELWEAWHTNMARTSQLQELRQTWRVLKYGEEIAARYSPGSTPEKVIQEHAHREEEAMREQEASELSEDGEWEKQAVIKRNRGTRVDVGRNVDASSMRTLTRDGVRRTLSHAASLASDQDRVERKVH